MVGYFGQRHVEVATLQASFAPVRNRLDGNADPPESKVDPKVRLHVPDVWLRRKRRPAEDDQKDLGDRLHKLTSPTKEEPEHLDKVNANKDIEKTHVREHPTDKKSNDVQVGIGQTSLGALALEAIYLGGYGDGFEQLPESAQQNILRQLCEALEADIRKRMLQRSEPEQSKNLGPRRPSGVRTSPELPGMDPHVGRASGRRASGKPAQAVHSLGSLPELDTQQMDQSRRIPEQRDSYRDTYTSNSCLPQSRQQAQQGVHGISSLSEYAQQQPREVQPIPTSGGYARSGRQVRMSPESPVQDYVRQQQELARLWASTGMLANMQDYVREQEESARLAREREAELARLRTSAGMLAEMHHVRKQEQFATNLARKGIVLGARSPVAQASTMPNLPAAAISASSCSSEPFRLKTWPELPSPQAVLSQDSLPAVSEVQEEQAYALPQEIAHPPQPALPRNAWSTAKSLSSSSPNSYAPKPRNEPLRESPSRQQPIQTLPVQDLHGSRLQVNSAMHIANDPSIPEGPGQISSKGLDSADLMESLQLLDICSKLSAPASLEITGDGYSNQGFFESGFQPPPGLSAPLLPARLMSQYGGATFSL